MASTLPAAAGAGDEEDDLAEAGDAECARGVDTSKIERLKRDQDTVKNFL
jgi:hypothetical protein